MVSSRLYPYQYQNPFPSSMNVENHETSRVSILQAPRGTSYGQRSDEPLTLPIGHPQPQTLPLRTPSHRLRLVVLLLISLLIPPLLSLVYLSAGHVILSRIHKSSSSSIYHVPILSSIEVGATGGLCFSLPVALTLYLLIFYNKRPVPEDFFEDDSITTGSTRYTTYVGYLVCVFFFVGIGGIAGPLGVTCLSSGNSNSLVTTKKILSIKAAAAAGFLGGVVLSVGGLLLGILTFLVWSFWTRRKI
jgi:hypothetical protein